MTTLQALIDLAEQHKLTTDAFARSLSAVKVRSVKAAGQHADGGGLVLHVAESGAKSWRYRFRLQDKGQTLTLGNFPEVSLERARIAHRAARLLVAQGVHPGRWVDGLAEAKADAERVAAEGSFRAVAEKWMNATGGELSATTVKHRKAMIEKHVMPTLAARNVAEITRKELHALLTAIDQEAPVTARHCRGYIKQIFEYAEDHELIDADPTPRARVLVRAASRRVVPRKALAMSRIGEFLRVLEDAPETDPLTKGALRLLVLTWCRTSEVTGARWEEFDLDAGIWTIPASRMKAREEHRVMLSRQAVELLLSLGPKAGGPVFPNRRKPNECMHRMTLTAWRKRWGFADVMEIHGLRAMASTWANEQGHRPDAIEAGLAHKEKDRVRAAYNRAEFFDQQRAMWQSWADVLDDKQKAARDKKPE
ncbi:MAG: integrase arm-type DNA-binding domain-containing protein [Nitrosomonas ureae]